MKETTTILIADDNAEIREVLSVILTKLGYTSILAATGSEAIEAMHSNAQIDLIIMDIMMPGLNGINACEIIRKNYSQPILFLSAKSSDSDKIAAYSAGGDDYIVKPFSMVDLKMKIAALLRRYYSYNTPPKNVHGIISLSESTDFDTNERCIVRNGEQIPLTLKEYDLLFFMCRLSGEVLDAHTLYEQVWGEKFMESSTNTLMVHILKLRKKIEDDPNRPLIIRTVWGKGYKLETN